MAARELTRDEKKKIRSLVTGMCANYDGESGLCLPLDCPCYMLHKCWTGAYCRYFKNAVLPLNPELEVSLTKEGTAPELRPCAVCGKGFLPEGWQRPVLSLTNTKRQSTAGNSLRSMSRKSSFIGQRRRT